MILALLAGLIAFVLALGSWRKPPTEPAQLPQNS
jgi:hypothetical protein